MPAAVDALGHLLALRMTAASADDRDQVAALAADVQAATGPAVTLAYVDQGIPGSSRRPTPRTTASSWWW